VASDRARVVLDVGGVRRSYEIHVVGEHAPAAAGSIARVHVRGFDGSLSLVEVPRFREPSAEVAPGSLVAAMPGSVLRLLAAEGDPVQSGQPILVLEAMKMEHTIAAPAAGTLTSVAVAVGAQVETGSLLAVIEPAQEPSP
jgi:propionyl-CoA carboxylase alpha chain